MFGKLSKGLFLVVSKPIYASKYSFKALDEIYKMYTMLDLSNPIWKPWKALLASVIRAKNTTPEKKPADRGNAARPAGSREKKVHTALCSANASRDCADVRTQRVRVRAAQIQKMIFFFLLLLPLSCPLHFCTLGLQSENQEKRFWQASSGRSSRPRRRNHQAAAKQRGREE